MYLLRWRRIAGLIAASTVLSVPGFAQSDTGAKFAHVRSSTSAARIYMADAGHEGVELPQNLTIPAIFRPIVEAMRLQSPTFRRQCLRIAAAPELTVVLHGEPPPERHGVLASTRIRHGIGRRHADIRIAQPARAAELIAHELEHVIEQLDGVDLRRSQSGGRCISS
jgi:hypothetical protein